MISADIWECPPADIIKIQRNLLYYLPLSLPYLTTCKSQIFLCQSIYFLIKYYGGLFQISWNPTKQKQKQTNKQTKQKQKTKTKQQQEQNKSKKQQQQQQQNKIKQQQEERQQQKQQHQTRNKKHELMLK